MVEIRTFILKKDDFLLNLGKRNFLSEKGNRVLKLSYRYLY